MASIEELEKRKNRHFQVDMSNSGKYTVKTAKFLTRRIIGVKDGEFELGPWEVLYLGENLAPGWSDGFWLTADCAEFGFSFNTLYGEDWPYSDCFWTVNDRLVEKYILIYVGGKESRLPTISICVDDELVVDKCNSPGREMIG